MKVKAKVVPIYQSLPQNVERILRELQATGLFGQARAEVIERLVCQWIQEHEATLLNFDIKITPGN